MLREEPESADYAIPILSAFTSSVAKFDDVLGESWGSYLDKIEQLSESAKLVQQARVYQIQNDIDNLDYDGATTRINTVLSTPDLRDEMWLYCQSQAVIIALANGDTTAAHRVYQSTQQRGSEIDPLVMESLARMLDLPSSGSTSIGNVVKNGTQEHLSPLRYQLFQNYPNPFNPVTTIRYALPEDAHVVLRIFDVLGRELTTLVNEFQVGGYKSIDFDMASYPSGLYFYRLQAGDYSDIKKMVLIK